MANIQDYLDLLIKEHKDKPLFVATVSAALAGLVDGLSTLDQIEGGFDLQTATGERLDYLGQWVGVSRDLDYPLPSVYFSLDDAGLGLDSGQWYTPFGPLTGIQKLPDDHYRLLIISRIMNNSWQGDISKAFDIWDNLVPPNSPYTYFIDDDADLSITVGLTSSIVPLDALTKALLISGKLDVKPAGVKSRYAYIDNTVGALFSFDLQNTNFSGFDTGYFATITE